LVRFLTDSSVKVSSSEKNYVAAVFYFLPYALLMASFVLPYVWNIAFYFEKNNN